MCTDIFDKEIIIGKKAAKSMIKAMKKTNKISKEKDIDINNIIVKSILSLPTKLS